MLNFLVKPGWLLTDLYVQDRISHENYGIYAALLSLSYLFINLADSGTNLFVTKKLAEERESLRHIFSHTFTFKILATVFYPFLLLGIGYIIGYRGQLLYYLFLLSFVQALLQTVAFLRANFQAFHWFRTDALASVTDKVLLLVIVWILFFTRIDLSLFIYAVLLSVVLTFIIYYLVIVRLHGWIRPSLNFKAMGRILRSSFPFALMGVLYAINERLDMVMLERLGGAQGKMNAGLYAASYRWLDAFMMYLWTILPVFFAKFAASKKEPEEQQKLFDLGHLITFFPMLFAGIFIQFYGDKFFWMFVHSTPEELSVMTDTLKVLFLTAMMNGVFALYGTYLNSTGHEKKVSYMIVLCILLNVVLNWIFIPRYGVLAAAWATFASTALISVFYLFYIIRKTTLRLPGKLILHISWIAISFILVFYSLHYFSVPWYYSALAAGLYLLAVTYFTNTGNIKTVFKTDKGTKHFF